MVHVAETLDLRFEVQVETPQSILGPDGTALVARMVHAGGRPADRAALRHLRLLGVHAAIAAAYQSLEHPVADHAKLVMQAAAAGTGVRLSDGSTNMLPVGDADTVVERWANHHRLVRRSWSTATTRAGTCTRPSCRRGTPRRTPSTARASPRALDRLAAYTGHTRAAIADEPATARALAARYVLRGPRLRRGRRQGRGAAAATSRPATGRPGVAHGDTVRTASGSAHGHGPGSEPVRQGGEPRRPDRPRHPAPRDPRPQRVDVAAR